MIHSSAVRVSRESRSAIPGLTIPICSSPQSRPRGRCGPGQGSAFQVRNCLRELCGLGPLPNGGFVTVQTAEGVPEVLAGKRSRSKSAPKPSPSRPPAFRTSCYGGGRPGLCTSATAAAGSLRTRAAARPGPHRIAGRTPRPFFEKRALRADSAAARRSVHPEGARSRAG